MAKYKYIGSLLPAADGTYTINLSRDKSQSISFAPGETFELHTEGDMAKVEYMVSPWTKEFEFVRVD